MPIETYENSSPKIRSIRTVKSWIQDGRLPTGEVLPPENELSRLLSVSRTTVRAAVKALEKDGLLRHNGNRRRIVVGPAQRGASLISDAVVILTHLADKPAGLNSLQAQTGWERYIQMGLVDAIQEAGMHALTLQLDLLRGDLIKNLISERPRGLIVMRPSLHPSASMELAVALRDQGVPVVFYGFTNMENFDTVTSDHAAGCYDLTKWLIDSGRKRLLRIWPISKNGEMPEWQRQRGAGFERAIAESGLDLLPVLEYPNLWNEQNDTREHFDMRVRVMVGYLFDYLKGSNPVDALVALTDGDCYALAAACRILSRQPNRDISIVGYDNYWQDSPDRHWEPIGPMATVDKGNLRLGHELMDLLLARAQGKLPPEPQLRLIKPELQMIEQASTD